MQTRLKHLASCRSGDAVRGVTSVCSAHPVVLRAMKSDPLQFDRMTALAQNLKLSRRTMGRGPESRTVHI